MFKFIRRIRWKQKLIKQREEKIWQLELNLPKEIEMLEEMKRRKRYFNSEVDRLKPQIEELSKSTTYEDRQKRKGKEKELAKMASQLKQQVESIDGFNRTNKKGDKEHVIGQKEAIDTKEKEIVIFSDIIQHIKTTKLS